MKHVIAVAATALALAGCSKPSILSQYRPVPEKGFKQLTYGMSVDQIESQGFACTSSSICLMAKSSNREGFTLFGHAANLVVQTENGKLESIGVSVDIPQTMLEDQVTKEFGAPTSFEYSTLSGRRATQLMWVSKAGTAIAMVRPPADNPGYAASHGSIEYNDKASTDEMIQRSKNAAIKAGDI